MAETKRKTWIDAARGFAMLFVIFGHVGNELAAKGVEADWLFSLIVQLLNPVKVPLFFAVSGCLFSTKADDTRSFIKKMLKSRLVPYVIWGTFMGVLAFGMDFAKTGFDTSRILPLLCENYIFPLFAGNLIWFIPCLIVTELIFFAINKISGKRTWLMIILCALCTVLGYYLSADSVVKPWKIDTALTCIQFMCLGKILKSLPERISNASPALCTAAGMGAYILLLCTCSWLWGACRVDINSGTYFNETAFTLLSFVGIYAFFSLARLADKIKPLVFIGRNTFVYFVWHMYAVKLILAIFGKLLLGNIAMSLSACIVTLAACLLVSPVCLIVNRYFAFSVGRYR